MSSTSLTALLVELFGENGGLPGISLAIGGFLISELFLILVVSRKLLKADMGAAWAGAAIIIAFQLFLTPDFEDAFLDIALYGVYTFSFSTAVFLAALLILSYGAEFEGFLKYLLAALLLIFSVLTAGGALVMTVPMLFVYIIAAVWYQARGAHGRTLIAVGAALYFLAFLINIFSPATQAELAPIMETLEALGESTSLTRTVRYSVITAVPYAFRCLNAACAVGALLLLPLLVKAARKNGGNYPLPALVSVSSFCLYVTFYSPSMYTLGLLGGGANLSNIYSWAFYL
ncbi:MAG: hypothetical protein LUE16_06855 [Lachnospiraceae bacterium]|nr:hypothetical protein [Lachnospiraceae bacterium]